MKLFDMNHLRLGDERCVRESKDKLATEGSAKHVLDQVMVFLRALSRIIFRIRNSKKKSQGDLAARNISHHQRMEGLVNLFAKLVVAQAQSAAGLHLSPRIHCFLKVIGKAGMRRAQ